MALEFASAHADILAATPLALFIGGAFVAPVEGGKMAVVDPSDSSTITADCPAATARDVDAAVAAASAALETWRKTTGAYVECSVTLC
jgi:betaine-aldehyde dehydrogenase